MKRWGVWIGLAVVALTVAVVLVVATPEGDTLQRPEVVPWGDPERGREIAAAAGCNGCHIIPGVKNADGTVGPPLIRWSERVYIAGSLTNDPENLLQWILDPDSVEPGTAMPDVGLTRQQAQHVVAYLFTIE